MVLKVGCILKILEWLFGRCWTRLHEQRFLHCTCYPSYIPMHEEIFTCLITLTQYNLDPALLPSSLVQLPLMELPEKATYIKLFLVWTLFHPFNSSSNKKLIDGFSYNVYIIVATQFVSCDDSIGRLHLFCLYLLQNESPSGLNQVATKT